MLSLSYVVGEGGRGGGYIKTTTTSNASTQRCSPRKSGQRTHRERKRRHRTPPQCMHEATHKRQKMSLRSNRRQKTTPSLRHSRILALTLKPLSARKRSVPVNWLIYSQAHKHKHARVRAGEGGGGINGTSLHVDVATMLRTCWSRGYSLFMFGGQRPRHDNNKNHVSKKNERTRKASFHLFPH